MSAIPGQAVPGALDPGLPGTPPSPPPPPSAPVARTVYPVSEEWFGIAREATPGTVVTPVATVPLDKTAPDDKPAFLTDKALRGSMAEEYQLIEGTAIGEFDINGPVYMDTVGYLLHNILGDYVSAGSAPSNATTLTEALAAGGTTVTIASGTGYSASGTVELGPSGGTSETLVIASVTGGTTLNFTTGARFPWPSGGTISTVTAPYTHTFSLLNSGNGQPATHTVTHFSGITALSGETPNYGGTYGARAYGCWCASEMTFNMDANGLVTHSTKGTAFLGTPSTANPVKSISTVQAQAGWEAQVSIGGTVVTSVTVPEITLARQLKPWFTTDGSQTAYIIARNSLAANGKLTFLATDDVPMMTMLENTQPSLQLSLSNGMSGASLVSLTFHCTVAAFDTVKFTDNEEVEWDATYKAMANTTDAGVSSGWSPVQVTLISSVATY